MVGQTAALFTALEVKTAGTKTTKEQKAFVDTVKRMGGIGAIVRKFTGIIGREDE